jgi:hypothetical protein
MNEMISTNLESNVPPESIIDMYHITVKLFQNSRIHRGLVFS